MNLANMILKIVEHFLKKKHPDLYSIHYSILAKITKVSGDKVNIRILDKYMNIDPDYPEIPNVKTFNKFIINEVKITNLESDNIMLQLSPTPQPFRWLPELLEAEFNIIYNVGDVVRVCFLYNDINMPYIEGKVDKYA
jgi:hypothetical protein